MRTCVAVTVLVFFSQYLNAQFVGEMRYVGKHEVVYNDEVLNKPHQIRSIVEEKNDPELTKLFRKYQRKRRTNQIFCGFGMFVGPSTAISEFDGTGRQINYWIFPVVAVATGGAIVSRKPAYRALKELVEKYNDIVLLERVRLERELANSNY